MPLSTLLAETPGTPEWWMVQLSQRMFDRNRMRRLAHLQAWTDNTPPIATIADSQRRAFVDYLKTARFNMAGAIVRSRVHRMQVIGIRTAAAGDDLGDEVADRYFTRSGLRAALPEVFTDVCTVGEGYIRREEDSNGDVVAYRADPRYTITAADPSNPNRVIAAMQLVWDEWDAMDYAFLWLPGEQWVAARPRTGQPRRYVAPYLSAASEDVPTTPYWSLSFDLNSFEMRPDFSDVEEDDGRPYTQTYSSQRLPITPFFARRAKGQFEDVLPSLKRINQAIMKTMTTSAVQAYKQRALQQELPKDPKSPTKDRLPPEDSKGRKIDWDDVFAPGPDALWKLPPGVSIWESTPIQLDQFYAGEASAIRQVAMETGTPVSSMMASDSANESAEGVQDRKEDLEFIVGDLCQLVTLGFVELMAGIFELAPSADRYAVDDAGQRVDRADAAQIIVDWAPVQRHSLAERADADSKSTSLSIPMRNRMIWGMSPSQAAINQRQLKEEQEAAAKLAPTPVIAPTAPPADNQPPANPDDQPSVDQ